MTLSVHRTAVCIASTERQDADHARVLRIREIDRRAAVLAMAPSREAIVEELTVAADQFLVERGDGHTVQTPQNFGAHRAEAWLAGTLVPPNWSTPVLFGGSRSTPFQTKRAGVSQQQPTRVDTQQYYLVGTLIAKVRVESDKVIATASANAKL